MDLIVYHASNVKIAKFDYKFLNSGTGNQQLGSGFYFADTVDRVIQYGKFIHTCKIKINSKKLENNQVRPLKYTQIRKIIQSAPNYKQTLADNFGDVEHQGFLKVLNNTIQTYHNLNDDNLMHTLFCFSNDFYDGHDYYFNQVIYKTLGINCIYENQGTGTIYNVFFSNQISILQINEYKE